MRYDSLDSFLKNGSEVLAKGPIALIFAEDEVEVASTLRHHLGLGFKQVVLFASDEIAIPKGVEAQILRVRHDTRAPKMLSETVNRVIAATHGQWLYYCYNAEYLFFPFCETRNVVDLLTFHTEERRDAMLTYVIDLYAGDLNAHPNAVSLEDAYLDRSGYYALGRSDRNGPKERQLDFYGGLRWRFEEHIPKDRRRIDRIALFRAKPDLKLSEAHLFNDEEYNTFACRGTTT